MRVLNVTNVNQALADGLWLLRTGGVKETSRNGPVIVAPGPVCTVYYKPWERVLFSPTRDANPFFHLMEALWMLAGRNDLKFPKQFNKRFGEYSDDGKTVPGAYGYRWRKYFEYDQLDALVKELRVNPNTRRAVLTMWNAHPIWEYFDDGYELQVADDLKLAMSGGKDVPCNTHAYFDVRGGKLNMTVCCRSNDIIWGAYGANAVHFSILMEYMAAKVGVPMGIYRQISNNYHLYPEVIGQDKLDSMALHGGGCNHYEPAFSGDQLRMIPLVEAHPDGKGVEDFEYDLGRFMRGDGVYNDVGWSNPFMRDVARPMYIAWMQRKEGVGTGLEWALAIKADDWRRACIGWIQRREEMKVIK